MNRFTVICTSDFNLYNRWFSGEDIAPVLEQRQSVGFNAVRVWTAYAIDKIGVCDPHRPGFYDRWPEFMSDLAAHSLYAEVTAFTGPYPFFPTQDAMLAHWNALVAALSPCTNLLDLEAVNEGDNGPNLGVPLDRLARPFGMLASHGSAVQDNPPMQPHWDVAGYRPPGSEWQRKVGHNAMEWADSWGIPVWSNETTRMPDNDSDVRHAEDAAASAALLCAGSCFHSPAGKDSTLFQGQELACAQAWVKGAQSVPLEFQAGRYIRVEDNPPGVLRVYRRQLNDGRFHEVQVRA